MGRTEHEINFRRLLNQCEYMASQNEFSKNWRLEKYIGTLEDWLQELKKLSEKPSDEVLSSYSRRVEFLKGLLQADKLDSAEKRCAASKQLVPPTLMDSEQVGCGGGGSGQQQVSSRALHSQHKARYEKELREELLARTNTSTEGLRERGGAGAGSGSSDVELVLKHHEHIQERIAEEMLAMTRSLKHTTTQAGRVINADNKRLDEAGKLTERNYDKLKVESDKLVEHSKASSSCTIWILLSLVCVIFVSMVLFIRLFPKR